MTKWWQRAVFYQVYPRSFMDGDGDGIGDLKGLTSRLDYLADLGVDALWISPFFPSPQVDTGYDVSDYCDIDPVYGTLADFDEMLAAAHARNIRVTIDLVLNHCSDRHPWFQRALAAGPGSAERDWFHFLDGRGPNGDLPPNEWQSLFGGSAWQRVVEADGQPGQWYYHFFAAEQVDFNWLNPEVRAAFADVMRFWLDRGVDGFRFDAADVLMKDTVWPEVELPWDGLLRGFDSPLHEIYRELGAVLAEYPDDRVGILEAGGDPVEVAALLSPDKVQLGLNFHFHRAEWSAASVATAVEESLAAVADVAATPNWFIDNHDVLRAPTRYAGLPPAEAAVSTELDLALGRRRARSLLLLMAALPGPFFIYNGQELGLENVVVPESELTDPAYFRSKGEFWGRDGCRVPLPWSGTEPPFGFSPAGVKTWLGQPNDWREFTVARQLSDADSELSFTRTLLSLRRQWPALGTGEVEQISVRGDVLTVEVAGSHRVLVNFGTVAVPLPAGDLVLSSVVTAEGMLPADAAVLYRLG